jgi:hypothetical protein
LRFALEGLLFTIVRFPCSIAGRTQIQILHIIIIVSHIDDFRMFDAIHIGFARGTRTANRVNARQTGVQFGIPIDDMVEFLYTLLQLRSHNTESLLGKKIVDEPTLGAIIPDFIAVVLINLDV